MELTSPDGVQAVTVALHAFSHDRGGGVDLERGGGLDYDYPEGMCHVDGQVREIPDHLRVPTGSGLTWYEYRVVAAEVDGTRYVDLEARYAYPRDDQTAANIEAETWRARVDLSDEVLTDVELGHALDD